MSHQLANAEVEYQSVLRFSGRRANANVVGIGAAALDFDYYKAGLPHADASAEDVAGMLIEAYEAAGIPCMSLAQDSGRGAYTSWLFDVQMDGKALPRWRQAMKGLRGPKLDDDGNIPVRRPRRDRKGNPVEVKVDLKFEAFQARMLPVWRLHKALGLDRRAIDPARVLRVMGAIHPISGRRSRMAWPSSIEDVQRVSFDAWCDALMPYTRAELKALRKERAAWKAVNPDHVPAVRSPRRFYGGKWIMIGGDLDRLLEHRGAGWFEQNKRRDMWTLFRAIAIAMTEGGSAEEWAERLAPRIGLPVAEVAASLSGVERGMRAHEAGETSTWKGVERSAFYDYSYESIVDELDIGIVEAGDADLRVLVPGGAAPLSAAERKRAYRDALNPTRATRPKQADARLAMGRRAWWMRIAGMSVAECARELGCSVSGVEKAIAYADSHPDGIVPLETIDVPAVDARSEAVENPSDVSCPIVVSDPISAPAAPVPPSPSAPSIQPGEIQVTRYTPRYAVIATATGRWDWIRVEGVYGPGWHDELDILTPPADVSAADRALVDEAVRDLARAATKPSRRVARSERRAPSRRRSVPIQAAPLAPLDHAADRAREAQLYLEASGGRSSLRDRLSGRPTLVAA